MNPGRYDVPLLLPPAIKDKVPSGIVLHALRVCVYDMGQNFSGRKLGGGDLWLIVNQLKFCQSTFYLGILTANKVSINKNRFLEARVDNHYLLLLEGSL